MVAPLDDISHLYGQNPANIRCSRGATNDSTTEEQASLDLALHLGREVVPLVSVIVSSYTTERLNDIQELLTSLQTQTYPNVEIVFVAEKSKELYERVNLLASKDRIMNLKTFFNDGPPGLASNRNYGVQRAAGEIIAFVDDDAVAFPNWVEEIVKTFAVHDDAIGVTGPLYPLWCTPTIDWLPEEFYWLIGCPTPAWIGGTSVQPVRNAWGGNMAFRRSAFGICSFNQNLGWNASGDRASPSGLAAEDVVFSLRVVQATGRHILYNPAIKLRHKVYQYRLSKDFVRRRSFWEGYTKASLSKLLDNERTIELSTELSLLRRILVGVLPKALWQLTCEPLAARRTLSLTAAVLFHLGIGYSVARFYPLRTPFVRRYM
jgi:glycosyltransferase involved in cell wall biosynthesis